MPIYEVTKGGLIKANSIHEYEVGEKFETKSPITDQATLRRVRVLSGSGQVEFVNQLDDQQATEEAAEEAVEEVSEEESNVIEVKFDIENADKEALLSKAKELSIRGAHLFGEDRLRKEIGLLLNK